MEMEKRKQEYERMRTELRERIYTCFKKLGIIHIDNFIIHDKRLNIPTHLYIIYKIKYMKVEDRLTLLKTLVSKLIQTIIDEEEAGVWAEEFIAFCHVREDNGTVQIEMVY